MNSISARTSKIFLKFKFKYLVILPALSLLLSCSSCYADNQTKASTSQPPESHPPDVDNTPASKTSSGSAGIVPATTTNPNGTVSNTGTTATPVLQGSVQKVELDLNLLQDIGLDLKHALKACSNLYDEVTIRPVRIISQPEVIGRGIIINIPIATQPTGPVQPARKDRVDLAMSGITPIITMLKKNVDEYVAGNRQLEMPDEVKEQLHTQFKDWVIVVNNLAEMGNKLTQLTQGPKYDNNTIAQQVAYMEQDIKKLDVLRNAIYKVVRKEGKRSSKSD